jgi:hypothetical protein
MKMVATWFRSGRGVAIGTVVGALTVGKATPYLLNAFPSLQWRTVVAAASAGAVVAAVLVGAGYRDGPFPFARRPFAWARAADVVRHRATRLAIEQQEQRRPLVRRADLARRADRGRAGLQRLQLAEFVAVLDRERRARAQLRLETLGLHAEVRGKRGPYRFGRMARQDFAGQYQCVAAVLHASLPLVAIMAGVVR